ncbi:MAG: hypothetical protein ACPGYY_00675 [Bacteroidia bacterium]
MKNLIVGIFILFGLSSFAQNNLEIRVSNSAPRVNEPITIYFSCGFISEVLDSQIFLAGNDAKQLNRYYLSSSEISKSLTYSSVGDKQIGPFSFTFNNKVYRSDSIVVTVVPDIPKGDGVWVRQMNVDGIDYILIEKVLTNYSNQSNRLKRIMEKGVTLDERKMVGLQLVKAGLNSYTGDTLYSCTEKYRIVARDKKIKSYKVTESDFVKYPKKIPLNSILIKF